MTQNNSSCQAKRSFVKCGNWFTRIIVILSYATVCLHPSVSLNNEQNCREISKDKIAVCRGSGISIIGGGHIFIYSCSQTVKTIDFKI